MIGFGLQLQRRCTRRVGHIGFFVFCGRCRREVCRRFFGSESGVVFIEPRGARVCCGRGWKGKMGVDSGCGGALGHLHIHRHFQLLVLPRGRRHLEVVRKRMVVVVCVQRGWCARQIRHAREKRLVVRGYVRSRGAVRICHGVWGVGIWKWK